MVCYVFKEIVLIHTDRAYMDLCLTVVFGRFFLLKKWKKVVISCIQILYDFCFE